jgi:tetratricopeptide (TPR) repeat protein
VLQLVETWLRGSGKPWLLVLDNADVEDALFKPVHGVNATSPGTAQKKIIDFLAIPSCGQTVLATRHNKVASQFVDDCDIITVALMTKSDASNLFRKKAGGHHDATDVEELVDKLGYIPLAIAHAAAFIKRKVPLCTVQTYLSNLEETIKSDTSLLIANYEELRRDPEANNSVINTWQVSFEHIRQIRPSAADRLSLMSFYDHRSIPRSLLSMRYTNLELTCPHTPTDADLDDDLLMLSEFHLISIGVGSEALELHPLIQLAARKWLQRQNNEDRWLRRSILNLYYALLDDSDYSSKWLVFLPHCRLALVYEPQDEASGLFLADLCAMASSQHVYYFGVSEYPVWARRCWAERTHHLGESHIKTLHAELELARLLVIFGKEEGAQSMLNHCLMLAEKHSHSNREWKDFHIECLHVMGQREASQGKLTDAECYFQRALELSSKHSEIAYIPRCVHFLKDVLLRQKKQSEAETICRQALSACIRSHGSEHECTMDLTSSLADVLFDKGNQEEALRMYNDISEGYKHLSGSSTSTMAYKTRIVSALLTQKKTQEATILLEQAYQMCRYHEGNDSELTRRTAHAYAVCIESYWECHAGACCDEGMRGEHRTFAWA